MLYNQLLHVSNCLLIIIIEYRLALHVMILLVGAAASKGYIRTIEGGGGGVQHPLYKTD